MPDGAWSAIGQEEKHCLDAKTTYPEDIYLEEVYNEDYTRGPATPSQCEPKPTIIDTAHITQSEPPIDSHTPELYDSGATCHMTPLKEPLANYRAIIPKPIGAANQ